MSFSMLDKMFLGPNTKFHSHPAPPNQTQTQVNTCARVRKKRLKKAQRNPVLGMTRVTTTPPPMRKQLLLMQVKVKLKDYNINLERNRVLLFSLLVLSLRRSVCCVIPDPSGPFSYRFVGSSITSVYGIQQGVLLGLINHQPTK